MTATYSQLTELLGNLAAQPVHVQLRFDVAFAESRDFAERLVAETGVDRDLDRSRLLLAAATPSRNVVRRSELDFRTRVRIERTEGLSIRVLPVNLGYEARYSLAHDRQSAFTLTVEQVPHPEILEPKEDA